MATNKRALYKPAVQDTNGPKERRKVLAQGRLVTTPTVCVAESLKDEGPGVASSAAWISHAAFSQGQVMPTSTGLNRGQATLAKSGSSLELTNEMTPRKSVPQVLLNDSPKPAKPTTSLELSDTEDERLRKSKPEVIVVDASRQIKSLDDTEVDISTHFAHSPAKVICHTPSKVHGDLRNTGNVEAAAKICVDKVPSLCIVDNEEEKQRTSLHKLPMVVRESDFVVKSTIDQPQESSTRTRALSHFQALMARSEKKKKHAAKQHEVDSSDVGSEFGEGDLLEEREDDDDGVPVTSGPPKIKSVTLAVDAVKKAGTKKKPPPRIVPSRYLQATTNAKGPLKATDRTLLNGSIMTTTSSTSSGNRSSRYHGGSLVDRTGRSKSSTRKQSSAAHLSGTANLSGATVNSRAGEGGAVYASTPKAEELPSFGNDHHEISAIAELPRGHLPINNNSMMSMSSEQGQSRAGLSENESALLVQGQQRKKAPVAPEVDQWALELLYGRHMQWAFVHTKARKTLQDQEKQATEQLSSLIELINKQDEREAELEAELAKLKHINCLDEALEVQFSGLSSSTDKLPQLKQQHHHLSAALDTTRHHIPTRGIYIPDNDDQYIDAIARALQESGHLLGEISAMTRTGSADIDQCAKVLQAMEKVTNKETNELSRCNVLLSAAESLTTHENSLMVQQIQSA